MHQLKFPGTNARKRSSWDTIQLSYWYKNFLVWLLIDGPCEGRSKKWGIPESVPSARYSLVKGERIVRSVLSTRIDVVIFHSNVTCTDGSSMVTPMLMGYDFSLLTCQFGGAIIFGSIYEYSYRSAVRRISVPWSGTNLIDGGKVSGTWLHFTDLTLMMQCARNVLGHNTQPLTVSHNKPCGRNQCWSVITF